ncbi:hypothetical protein DC487_17065 [Sphingobacterium corticibacter]|uniref:Uncharacterized protein n=1 Tax=Sphingobacterium corticibacter TaxID=2171749 RepID=A0A2T8HEP1_9SPHI|nr:hypothetical protein DC487_17065 [Sphingobacterium corticibacter]
MFGFAKQTYFKQKQHRYALLTEYSKVKHLVLEYRCLMPQIGIRKLHYLRPHLSCKILTPIQMHAQQNVKIKTYKKTLNSY